MQVRFWFIVSIVYLLVDMILFIPRTIYTSDGKIYLLLSIFNFVYMLYELWIVHALLDELSDQEEPKAEDQESQNTDDTVVIDSATN